MKRTISLLLCLMMVFGLFTGAMTSANAASFGVTVDPASAVIEGTGSVDFTVKTILDSLADQLQDGKQFDLSELVKGFLDEGLSLDALAALLNSAGFNWDDIVNAMQDNGINIAQIADMLKGLINGDQLNLEDLVKDLMGDTDLLGMLINALSNAGFSSELLNSLLATMQNMDTQGLMEILLGMLGGIGQNSSAKALSLDAETTILDASDFIDTVKELFGEFLTEEQLESLKAMAESWVDSIPLPEALAALKDALGENFTLEDAVQFVNDLTNGDVDYTELLKAALETLGENVDMEEAVKAFSDVFGEDLDLAKLAEALMEAMNNGFDLDALKDALGENVDLDALLASLAEKLSLEDGDIDVPALVSALVAALEEQDIKNFDFEKFAQDMGEDFDLPSFLQSVADKLSDGKIDLDAVKQAVEDALGEQIDLQSIIDAFKNGIGEDLDVGKLLEALVAALESMDVEVPSLDSLLEKISDALGTEITPEQLEQLISALKDLVNGDQEFKDILESLLNGLKDKINLDDLFAALQDVLGEDFGGMLKDILQALLDSGFDFNEILDQLKNFDFDPQQIMDLLFADLISYQWQQRTSDGAKPMAVEEDLNTYSGADTRTLTVSRDVAPEADETYTYFCTLTVFDNELTSSDAVLVIKAESDPADPTTDPTPDPTADPTVDPSVEPTAEPTGPVLDNEKHVAYLNGYSDGTVRPDGQITRAEVATILYRLLTEASRTAYGTRANSFSDVADQDWFCEAVSTLANAKVILGYPNGTFQPNAPISRAELATVLTRLSVLVSMSKDVKPVVFSDVPADHWAASFIKTAADNGWINGYTDGTFRPGSAVTRAEAVTMLNRMLDRNPQTLPTSGMKTFSDNMNPNMWYYKAIQEAANGHEYTRNADGTETWVPSAA